MPIFAAIGEFLGLAVTWLVSKIGFRLAAGVAVLAALVAGYAVVYAALQAAWAGVNFFFPSAFTISTGSVTLAFMYACIPPNLPTVLNLMFTSEIAIWVYRNVQAVIKIHATGD